jgi:hypothetical protein
MPTPGRASNDNTPSATAPQADAAAGARRRRKRVLVTEDLPRWLIEGIARAEMDTEFDHLDDE